MAKADTRNPATRGAGPDREGQVRARTKAVLNASGCNGSPTIPTSNAAKAKTGIAGGRPTESWSSNDRFPVPSVTPAPNASWNLGASARRLEPGREIVAGQ